MTINVGDRVPDATLTEFIETETAGCTLGPNAFQVADLVKGKKILMFALPGAFTPTEIYEAWELGASMVKLYPASVVGPAYVSAVLAPLNKVKLMPTGGIHLSNMLAFMNAGATSLGIGSELFDKKIIQKRDSEAMLNHFKLFAQQMQLSK